MSLTRDQALAQLTAKGQPFEIAETDAIGRRIRAFVNAPRNLRELFAATRSDKEFLIYEDERYTFEETWQRAATLANALVNDFGIKKGDRIAVSMRNYPEWVVSYMAVTSIGAMFVAMNALWTADEMAYGLTLSEPTIFIADQERVDRLASLTNAPAGFTLIAV
ncbi:MAG: long-chain fatty acid--CoA ligase, partial [Burkholderiales bacterium]